VAFLARRATLGALTILLLTLVAFVLLQIAPGDAVIASLARSPGEGGLAYAEVDELRAELGLDRSWPAQYVDWLRGIISLSPGESFATGRPVAEEIGPRIATTVELAIFSVLFITVAGLGGGLAAARYRGGYPDLILRGGAFLSLGVPSFWLALVLIVSVAAWTGHFLALGYQPLSASVIANLGAIMPAATILAVRPAAVVLRVVRSSTLEASNSQHFLMARARGVSHAAAIARHAFRTAMLPALTVIGAQAVFVLGGVVVIEQVFGLPGLGRLLVSSVQARDFPVVQALVLMFGVATVGVNVLIDVAYVVLDPRLRGQ